MLKVLGVVLGGVFVGAVGMEIVRRKCPDTRDKVYAKIRRVASDMKTAFKEGYRSAVQSPESASASA